MEYKSNNKEIRELRKQIYYLSKYGETGVGAVDYEPKYGSGGISDVVCNAAAKNIREREELQEKYNELIKWRSKLYRAIKGLQGIDKELVIEHYMQGKSYKELSKAYNISTKTIQRKNKASMEYVLEKMEG